MENKKRKCTNVCTVFKILKLQVLKKTKIKLKILPIQKMKSSVEGSEFKFEGIVHTNQLEPRYATGSNRKYCKVLLS